MEKEELYIQTMMCMMEILMKVLEKAKAITLLTKYSNTKASGKIICFREKENFTSMALCFLMEFF